METWSIIWDYDGTILPFTPYDSEQFLLDYLLNKKKKEISLIKRIVARAAIFADKKQILGHSFKKYFIWVLKGIDASVLEEVGNALSASIPESYIDTLSFFAKKGFKMYIISCGTADLCLNPLKLKKADTFFSEIISNPIVYKNNKVDGIFFNVKKGSDKVKIAEKLNLKPEKTIVVGDGYTDIPLLDWSSAPFMIDPEKTRRKKYSDKNYTFIESLPQIIDIMDKRLK